MTILEKIPEHLGIIIDGNRRWAEEKGLPSFEGHRRGLDNVKRIGDWCYEKRVKIITFYAFSIENWNRTKIEVAYLMKLLEGAVSGKYLADLNEKKIQLQVIGQKERLSKSLQYKIIKAEKSTRNNKNGILNLAVSYGGRAEIVQAIKNIIKNKTAAEQITEDLISENLWTRGLPSPDLIIRTGGEQRLSNFLTWQSIYSELYFTDKYWPDFNENDLDKAFFDFSQRERRLGK
ncbi:MAG: di-trans,poly-cis-decaprenylcistransferase [Candidatus Nealsonbacteria bacterium RIFCSPLOWO2_12_FULL_39_31]|uniref:Isoprenyl transferase n=3 Tax=Candidatus Nealsoniibacteriota TaxID=1817911 RepID=A0A1G2ELX4_9BACT|nr:MAG: Isoprenyl transferase [Parcubacteria group bacterium GW2011_GWA2_38_27]OGZ20301.1 MAG: di-trans,poly-cis-decaprenylcistransferase [Candidatus Nealsonbacteria bacterium RIFCSPHIGHO2_01_FULL_38_55]OGZ20933.1 MAG: di-trans,poly-cis-decaprenylcistransferase [Candidatus Nealsonbacteria bacterium RIFCSPHIGHO2_02_FULL_38_75]OGZ22846.1 MAG: di-trans,poly-cis-decaprenylcistransferase [Candidatus Nealsonbacteria bacterium RIFCSPHIGHO2_12_FULL_38_18]OGZ23768.1 MAG: di-trans,poly-cis-decaprenylcist